MTNESNELVKGLIDEFKAAGLEISHANYGEYAKPEKIRGCTPDVIGWDPKKELYYLGTVAEQKDLDSKEMESKIQTLSQLAMGKGNSARAQIPYYVGVPKEKSLELSKLIDQKIPENDNVLTIEL